MLGIVGRFTPYYITRSRAIIPSSATSPWAERASENYKGGGLLVAGDNYAVCLNDDGMLDLLYQSQSTNFLIADWPKLSHLLSCRETLVGLANNGVVHAAGEDSHKFNGWANIAFLSKLGDKVFGIRWDGSCICTDENYDLSKADLSWLLNKDFN